jgi:hypothetical protein
VFFDLLVLARKLEELAPPAAEPAADDDLRSRIAVAADSR